MDSSSKKTRSTRIATAISAVLIDSEGGEVPVEIVDLSSDGFRLRSHEVLVEGEEVRLRVDRHGDFPAKIQWVLGFEAGGRFREPVVLL